MATVAKTTAVASANTKMDIKPVRKIMEIVYVVVKMGFGIVLAANYVRVAVKAQYVTKPQENV